MTSTGQQNPFIELDEQGRPLYQLKLSLVLYLDYAPGPKRARRVYDRYLGMFGDLIRVYQSTSWMGPAHRWNDQARTRFEQKELPHIQRQVDWGYAFTDGQQIDNHMFMLHGYKPASEAGKASFFRFEWPWNTNSEQILALATALADEVPFLSGSGGYILKPKPFYVEANDRMYAIVRRYWGIEAWGLDTTVNYVLEGYKCPSWLTLIGNRLLEKTGHELDLMRLGPYLDKREHGLLFQSRSKPEFIDRNRDEHYDGEREIAEVLLPLQITAHEPFGGQKWTEDTTLEWLQRFTLGGVQVPQRG